MSEGDDATLPDTRGAALSAPARTSAAKVDLGTRYELGDVLGRGGMGEVRLAQDTRIHREVAVKLLRGTLRDDVTLGRFFREARIQGVLEHPAVVPVHDLGIDADGNPYFVMKRLAGITLADVLTSSDPELRGKWPRRQLLARLIDVCLAIELAHTRGVIHRDLKPANLMLGDFGEAYVLDWGLARLAGDHDAIPGVAPLSGDDLGHTEAGDLLGTPGYMSPEQARGEPVGTGTDVFALGCVLYEILAGVPALPRGLEGIAQSLISSEHRPSKRTQDVPPELDDLCARATHAEPAARPTARELADGIQAYLDGDRDLARRRELAIVHAEAAHAALAGKGDEARATGMREAGRALALDPDNALAQQVLGRLLLDAPAKIPAEAMAAAEAERAHMRQMVIGWAARGFGVLFCLALVLLLLPVRERWPIAVAAGLVGATSLLALHLSRRTMPARSGWYILVVLLTMGQLSMAGLMLGPLLILPIFTVGAFAGFLAVPTAHSPLMIAGMLGAPLVVLAGLEVAGVLPQSVSFQDGALVLRAWIIDLSPVSTAIIIGLSVIVQTVNTSVLAIHGRRSQDRALDRVHTQTWHMQQLLPRALDTARTPKVDPPA